MRDLLHITVLAATAARRARLAELVRRDFKGDSVNVRANLSEPFAGEAPADLWVADLETPAAAASWLRRLERSPVVPGAVALIDNPDPSWVRPALIAGVNAIISREPEPEELRLAMAAAEAGLVLLLPSSARHLAARALTVPESIVETEELTRREREVLRLISDGLGNKEIAALLTISEHTAKFHISSILGKLGVDSRVEAVTEGVRRGLIAI